MKNLELAKIFYDIADILELKNVEWKPVAYRKAARALESLSEDVETIYTKGGIKALEEIPGIGEGIAKKIIEFIETGKVKEYAKLKKTIPAGLSDLLEVPGLGPKKAAFLYKKLKIKSIKDLERAAKKHKISKLATFKKKSEENILQGIKIYKGGQERKMLGIALPVANDIVGSLRKLKAVGLVSIAGSLRRRMETVKDIDILVMSKKPKEVMGAFTKLPMVKQVIAKGATKSSVLLKNNLQVDLRVVPKESFGAAMQYFTGSKDHNIKLRKIAIEKKLKLSEYGVFDKKGKRVAGATEKEVYKKLGLAYIEPELRENRGEIEAAKKGKLPKLVQLKDIKGDFHVHSKWSDGVDTIEAIAKAAKKLGYEYINISDHSKSQHIAHGLNKSALLRKIKEIKKVNKKIKGIRVFCGAEVDIMPDGSLDYSDDILKKLDIVTASVHARFKMSKSEMTKRITKAMENKYVKIIAHPTGRMFGQRDPYELDMEKLFKAAKETNTFLEITCTPARMDLSDINVKAAAENGLIFSIGTDAHSIDQLGNIEFGVAIARRGWCSKKNIINTLSLKQIKNLFKV